MARKTSEKRIKALSVALFFMGLALVAYLKAWWPGIMLAIGLPLALRQYLLNRHYDMWISLFVFVGVFVTVQFDISWQVVLPVLFAIGGVYILFREYLEKQEETEAEKEEDLNKEIEEERRK